MKLNTKIITIIFAILLLSTLGTALSWTQYTTTTPTTDTILHIATMNPYAMAQTSSNQVLFFNGTHWYEVAKPVGAYTTYIAFDKATDGNFYWGFSNNNDLKTYSFNPNTQIWSLVESISNSGNTANYYQGRWFACIQQGSGYTGSSSDAECYYVTNSSGTINVRGMGAIPDLNGFSQSVVSSSLWGGTTIAFIRDVSQAVQTYNGVSWSSFSIGVNGHEYSQDSPSKFCVMGSATGLLSCYNSTSATMQGHTLTGSGSNTNSPVGIQHTSAIVVAGRGEIDTFGYFTPVPTLDINPPQDINAIDFDYDTNLGWMAGSLGIIYHTGTINAVVGGGGNVSTTHSITTTASPNPVVYGQPSILGATAFHSGGYSADISMDIYNSTGANVYGLACTVPNGIICSTTVEGVTWTNFKVNQNYTITIQANWSNGDNELQNTVWQVINNATTESTIYQITQSSTYSNPQFTNIVATARNSNNNGYFVANNGTDIYLLSADSNNINNLVVKGKKINIDSSADYATSLDTYTNLLFLGTNDQLYAFSNATTGDANKLQQDSSSYGFFDFSNDYINGIATINNNTAWMCINRFSTEADLFNESSQSFGTSISQNPCKAIIYNNGALYIHSGTSGVKIYNSNTNALLSSIAVTSYPNTNQNDMLSIYGNTLALTSGTNRVRLYDITTPSSPVYITQCLIATAEIRAIELLNSNTAIIGTDAGQLRVCDISNNATYDATNAGFLTTNLKSYLNGEQVYEIEKLDDNGKFQVAEGNRYSVYTYVSNTQTTQINSPPSITQIYTPVTTVCTNEILNAQIQATDANSDPLTYDYTCEGIKINMINNYITNSFTCSYATAGTKTIKAFVNDGQAIVTSTKNIIVNNCVASAKIELKILDGATTNPVSGVSVAIPNQTTQTSDNAGIVLFNNLTNNVNYQLTLTKGGYFTKTATGTPSIYQQIVYLEPTTTTTGASITTLQILALYNNQPVENALASVTDPLSGISKYAFTDASGTATITNMFATTKGILSVGKTGEFALHQEYFSIGNGEQKIITINLASTTENLSSGRGCQDTLKGIILCSPLRVDLTGDTCTANTDCITGRCDASVGTRHCSTFNWTLCDASGMDRSGACFTKYTTGGVANNITGGLLDNFLYVLVGIVIFIMIIMLLSATRRK